MGQGQRKRYRMNLPDFYELYDDTEVQAGHVHFDAQDQVRYALAVQDLVEICLESDHRPELCRQGTLSTARSNPESSIIEIVCPRSVDTARFPVAEGISLGEHGRRLLPVERNTNMFTILTPGTRSGVGTDIASIAMEILEEAKMMNGSSPPSATPTLLQKSETLESSKKKTPASAGQQRIASSSSGAGKQVKIISMKDLDESNEGSGDVPDSNVKAKKKRRSSKAGITAAPEDSVSNEEAQAAAEGAVNKPKRKRSTSPKKKTSAAILEGTELPQLQFIEENHL